MARPIARFTIDPQQERALRHAAKAPSTPQRVAQRCRVLLARGQGLSQAEAERSEGLARNKVGQWERRFATQGLAGLEDRKGRGRKSTLDAEKKARVITEVTRPPEGRTRWTVRGMARHAGVSVGAVHGLWRRCARFLDQGQTNKPSSIMSQKTYQRYTPEFKEQALGLIALGKPVSLVW